MIENLEGEIWKDIPGFEGLYQVSNMGRVKSLTRKFITKDGHITMRNGKLLKARLRKGYLGLNLKNGNKTVNVSIHRTVLLAFYGPSILKVVHHINSNKTDNRLENLEYCTYRENNYHSAIKKKSGLPVGVAKRWNKYHATIKVNKKLVFIGSFNTAEEAGMAYQNYFITISKIEKAA